jgi:hypothetical protein
MNDDARDYATTNTPIVACYLIYDWERMIATLDRRIPPARANVNGSGSASANELFARSVLRMGVPVAPRNVVGLLIAGPLAAAIGVLMRFALRQKNDGASPRRR